MFKPLINFTVNSQLQLARNRIMQIEAPIFKIDCIPTKLLSLTSHITYNPA